MPAREAGDLEATKHIEIEQERDISKILAAEMAGKHDVDGINQTEGTKLPHPNPPLGYVYTEVPTGIELRSPLPEVAGGRIPQMHHSSIPRQSNHSRYIPPHA